MTDTFLGLGGVLFQDHEIPETITAGGAQSLIRHKMIGGRRVVDAMGADDTDIIWAGRFQGTDAAARCRRLDTLRRSGAPVLLTWWDYRYTVIVAAFEWRWQRFYQIPYAITLCVVEDLSQTAAVLSQVSLDELLGTDLGSATSFASTAGLTDVNASLMTLRLGMAQIGSLAGATLSVLAPLQLDLVNATAAAYAAADQAEAAITAAGAVGGVLASSDPLASAAALLTGAQNAQELFGARMVGALTGRMGTNITVAAP